MRIDLKKKRRSGTTLHMDDWSVCNTGTNFGRFCPAYAALLIFRRTYVKHAGGSTFGLLELGTSCFVDLATQGDSTAVDNTAIHDMTISRLSQPSEHVQRACAHRP